MHVDGGENERWSCVLHILHTCMNMCTYIQITAAAPLRLHCSVFMMRRANISKGLGSVRGDRGGRKEWNEGEKGSKKRGGDI